MIDLKPVVGRVNWVSTVAVEPADDKVKCQSGSSPNGKPIGPWCGWTWESADVASMRQQMAQGGTFAASCPTCGLDHVFQSVKGNPRLWIGPATPVSRSKA